MRLVSKLRPSPAMVVAIIALVLAAGGVGYAASTINGKVLKNRSVAGKKLKKNTLTGTEIRESKLGKVPKAKSADTALHANTADNATNAISANSAGGVSTMSFHATQIVSAAADFTSAPQIPLGSKGPFSFYGKCYVTGASLVEATTYIASTSNTGMFDTQAENGGYVTPSTPEDSRKLQRVTTLAANTFNAGDGDKDFMATDGSTTIYGIVGLAAAKSGSPPEGDGPFGPGNRCMFGEVIFG